jgi:hypothetical protein
MWYNVLTMIKLLISKFKRMKRIKKRDLFNMSISIFIYLYMRGVLK